MLKCYAVEMKIINLELFSLQIWSGSAGSADHAFCLLIIIIPFPILPLPLTLKGMINRNVPQKEVLCRFDSKCQAAEPAEPDHI